MASVFTRIIHGELPGAIAYDDDQCIVLMSINPLQPGHALVIPRTEIDSFTDLDASVWQHLTEVARRVAKAQESIHDAERIGLSIAGYEVPHVHIHVWPSQSIDDFSFSNAAASAEPDDLAREAERLREAMAAA